MDHRLIVINHKFGQIGENWQNNRNEQKLIEYMKIDIDTNRNGHNGRDWQNEYRKDRKWT